MTMDSIVSFCFSSIQYLLRHNLRAKFEYSITGPFSAQPI
jgi:hypothetical protein